MTTISLDGRFVSFKKSLSQILDVKAGSAYSLTLNIACKVRRCKSVNTKRGFFGCGTWSGLLTSSLRLHATVPPPANYRKDRKRLVITRAAKFSKLTSSLGNLRRCKVCEMIEKI